MTILTEATRDELEAELAVRKTAEVVEATAPAKAATEAVIADKAAVTAAGIKVGTESIDEAYVTLDLPDPLPDNWSLIRKAMSADPKLHAVDGNGVLRVHKNTIPKVLDFLESNLPEVE